MAATPNGTRAGYLAGQRAKPRPVVNWAAAATDGRAVVHRPHIDGRNRILVLPVYPGLVLLRWYSTSLMVLENRCYTRTENDESERHERGDRGDFDYRSGPAGKFRRSGLACLDRKSTRLNSSHL